MKLLDDDERRRISIKSRADADAGNFDPPEWRKQSAPFGQEYMLTGHRHVFYLHIYGQRSARLTRVTKLESRRQSKSANFSTEAFWLAMCHPEFVRHSRHIGTLRGWQITCDISPEELASFIELKIDGTIKALGT